MQPLIYLSYGMTKSGSTLAYQLARTALEACGMAQPLLKIPALRETKHVNFIEQLEDWRLEAVLEQARALGHMVVLKTHTRPDQPIVRRLLEDGLAIGHAVCRDPRDMALSMLDHGVRSRKAGNPEFSEFDTIASTLPNLRHQVETLRQWLSLPNILPLAYDDLAFDTATAARQILRQLGLVANPAHIAEIVLDSGRTNKNIGAQARHLSQMERGISAAIAAEFAPLLDKLIHNRAALPRDGRPVLHAEEALRNIVTELAS